jgi:hypothetical protein
VKIGSLLGVEDAFSKCLLVQELQENEFSDSNIVKYVFTLTERLFFIYGTKYGNCIVLVRTGYLKLELELSGYEDMHETEPGVGCTRPFRPKCR